MSKEVDEITLMGMKHKLELKAELKHFYHKALNGLSLWTVTCHIDSHILQGIMSKEIDLTT